MPLIYKDKVIAGTSRPITEEILPNSEYLITSGGVYAKVEEILNKIDEIEGNGGNNSQGFLNTVYDMKSIKDKEKTEIDQDGKEYIGATEYEIIIPNLSKLDVGLQIIVKPDITSATEGVYVYVNGQRGRIYTTTATTGSFFNGTRVDFINANKPLVLLYMGLVGGTDMPGWKCLNTVRVNIEAIMSNGDAGYNNIAVSNGKEKKLKWVSHKDLNLVGSAEYNSTKNRFDLFLPGIGNKETGSNGVYTGMEITLIPEFEEYNNSRIENNAGTKLAVNNYTLDPNIGSKIYLPTGKDMSGATEIPEGYLKHKVPTKLKYTGSGWRIIDTPYIRNDSIKETIKINKGGTGATTKEMALKNLGAASAEELKALAERVAALEQANS